MSGMKTLGVIIARKGSKGLPRKNLVSLLGRPLISYTIEHAQAATGLDKIVVSTDWPQLAAIAEARGVEVIDRPVDLAHDTTTVDAPARHATAVVETREQCRYDAVVILYGNIPLRPAGLIDRSLKKLRDTGCDSVQSVYPVGKIHPLWMRVLHGPESDRIEPYQPNNIYRRQDLPPVYMLDAGLIAVRRDSLFTVIDGQPHAFLGDDRRGIVTQPGEVMDVDDATDLAVAETLLRRQGEGQTTQSRKPAISVRSRRIAADEPAYVIAELGVNHDGSPDRALQLTRAARTCGADAIKLQLFDPALLLSAEAQLADYQRASAENVFDMLTGLQLSVDAMAEVGALAHELGMAFIVTCFNIELVGAVRRLNPDAIKVASPDAVNLPLLDALAGLNKPMIVSTGACELRELSPLVELAEELPLAAMQCVSSYPTAEGDAALGGIEALRSHLNLPVGYSDHTTDEHTGMLAVMAGACILEKHLTYDRTAPGPDHAASFDPAQLQRYIALVRKAHAMRSGAEKRVLPCEREVRSICRQSVCAVRDLPAGTVLRREDLTVKRPGTGIPAARLTELVGRSLRRAIGSNELLTEDHLASADASSVRVESAA